jgi:hypothetical protein
MTTKSNQQPIVVVANDAGGGEILAAYLKTQPGINFVAYTAGPAARIFEREGLPSQPAAVDIIGTNLLQHREAGLVLTGTGWMTPIERLAIIEAKKLGIPSAAFLDHWVNYRERFGYPDPDWQANLPDQIWVGDEAAEQLAREFFPTQVIRLVPNPYVKSFAARYHTLLEANNAKSSGVLFIGEPNSYCQEVVEALLTYLAAKSYAGLVILRPHPAEGEERYIALVNKYSNQLTLDISQNRNILDDFLRCRVVVGMESAALAVAAACGKPTVSFITAPQVSCPVPLATIIKIRTAAELPVLDSYLI